MKKKIVLAYSGGLDTSVCVPWLKDRGYDVVCYMADVGQAVDPRPAIDRGRKAGAVKIIVEDLKEAFVRDYVWPSLRMNALYEGRYSLATALSRPLIAEGLVRAARKEHAVAVGHGCTGKGNDQVRIEMGVRILAPDLEILAPVREWELKSREEEIRYALKRKIPIDVTKKSPYSIDKNVWGVSIECGVLEDPWNAPPADAYQWTRGAESRMPRPEVVTIEFERGIPISINGKKMSPVRLIEALNRKGARFGIGRTDMIENRMVGIKSREIYEAPAAEILIAAHKDLESLTMDRLLFQYKEELVPRYAKMIYEGYWFTDLKKALDAFVKESQKKVSGTVKVKLCPYKAVVCARRSPHSLYRENLATYSEKDQFDQSLAKGFIELTALALRKDR
ncbi:MAG: argininosuccinate synthase [Candidatus Omnitrophica bacterium]|nr:argininosuccinate synthase [Candidatus Omnitrophota bacterium]